MLGSLSSAASGSGRRGDRVRAGRAFERRRGAQLRSLPEAHRACAPERASAANAAPGGARPRSRARDTRASGFTAASSGKPVCAASACAALRLARARRDDAEQGAPRDRASRSAAMCGARRGRREHRRSRRWRRSSRVRAPGSSRLRPARRSRRSRAARSRRRGRARARCRCSSIRSACSGSAGAGSTRQRSPCASPAASSAGATTGPQAMRRSASGTATCGRRHLGGISRRERQIEHEGTLVGGSERHRAGGRAHASAGAEQRDVTLVAAVRASSRARRSSPPRPEPDAAPGASIGRSTIPTAPQSSACRAALTEPAGATRRTARLGAPRTLAAHEVAGRCDARSRPPAACRHRPREPAPAARCSGRPASAARSSSVSAASPPSSARRTITSRRRARAGVASRPAPRRSPGQVRPRTVRARVTEMPPERSLAGESNSSPRAATREPLRPEDHDVDESPALQQPRVGRRCRRPARARPHARRAGATTARHPARSAPRTQEVAARQADERATAGQRAEPADHRRRAVGGGDRHRRRHRRRRTMAPAAIAVPQRQHGGLAARRLRAAVRERGRSGRARGPSRQATGRAGGRAARSGSRDDGSGRRRAAGAA